MAPSEEPTTDLTFMCPCIVSIIINDQQDATIFDLFNSSLLYMFWATLSPIIRSTKLYLQLQVLSTILLLVGVVDEVENSISSTLPASSTIGGQYEYLKL
jgi:hypothetical protein